MYKINKTVVAFCVDRQRFWKIRLVLALWGRTLSVTPDGVPAPPKGGNWGKNPFRLAATRQSTFPKGTAFGGGGKVSGIAQRRPLGGAGERSEPEGLASALPPQKQNQPSPQAWLV